LDEPRYHLAQLNIARARASLDDPLMEGFVSQLEHVNTVADGAPGFVWRSQSDEGDATAIRAVDDPRIIVNLSVWESIEALHDYVYRGDHVGPLRDRKQWFERMEGPSLVLWWIPSGSLPRVEQGMARLKYLHRHGSTAKAFTLRETYPPPGRGVIDRAAAARRA
jgi:hypothetical protein